MNTKKEATAAEGEPEPLNQRVCQRMRAMRKKRGWTLEQLASLSGVSRSMLSQIERGGANPTLGVAFRIAQAFGLSLGDLVDDLAARARIEVIRADDTRHLFREDEQVRIRTLSPLNLEKDVEFYELLLKPGGVLASEPHFAGTREFLTIEKGSARLAAGDQTRELGPGDSAHYPADLPHRIENTAPGETLAFLVDIYPS
jgi:transcriptional regulator with XRE-family HTH domain